jgi:hypothetical protein
MASSLLSGVLKSLFGMSANGKHWVAVKNLMEQSFGPIKIDTPIEGGKVYAFFEKQTLVGDESLIRSKRHNHALVTVGMDEAVGKGKNTAAAIIGLWESVTELEPHETILQMQEFIYNGEQHALYNSFRFCKGAFEDCGKVGAECPPARPDHIEKFLADERQMAMNKTETEVISGPRPGSSKT